MLSIKYDGNVAVVTLNNPPVNAIGLVMRKGLQDAVAQLDADDVIQSVLLIASGRTFIAGADIAEFDKTPEPPHLPDVVNCIETARKPWVAAIHGTALGGGLEIALGCHYRLATRSTRLGLPEVTLGLVPGAGGTVRLSRLVPTKNAVQLVTSGKPVAAIEALALGLVDALMPDEELQEEAVKFARGVQAQGLPIPLSARSSREIPDAEFWSREKEHLERKARGQTAPLQALHCIRLGVEKSAEDALAYERKTFLQLRSSAQAAALRRVFFAERAAGKPPEIKDLPVRTVQTVAVIGGGTMGAGIVAALRDANFSVVLIERDEIALERGRANVQRLFDGALTRGRLDVVSHAKRLEGVRYSTDYASASNSDVVIEAVFEDLTVKQGVFSKLDEVCRRDAILATNTSYLDPNKIAQISLYPERVLGLHFFSPANVMKLLEVIPTNLTSPEVLATGFALARALRKIPVQAGICDGFIGNRILKTTRAQAERLLLSGATPVDVDRAMRRFGMPMGPFEAQDLGGLDIAAFQRNAARERGEATFAPVAERLVAIERLGQKTRAGWYDYQEGDRTPHVSNQVSTIIDEERACTEQITTSLTDDELSEHIVFPMINEGARILQEGISQRAADIDLVEIHGYGFPRWRGGLMHYAEVTGLDEIVEKLRRMAAAGLCEEPCDYLLSMATVGRFE